MAVTKTQKLLLKKFKNQIRTLQKKEEQGRNQLRAALKKISKLGKVYKTKLDKKVRLMKHKVMEVQSSTYAKAAADLQRTLLKNIEAKGKALISAVTKIEKKHAAKLSKGIARKRKSRSKASTKRAKSKK